jgi:hypothetical protein
MKAASATLAAVSLLLPRLEDSDVGGVCCQRCPDVEADVDVSFPVEDILPLLFSFELPVSVVDDMTLFHNHVIHDG